MIKNQANIDDSFTYIADTFILTASLTKEKLFIVLEDKINKIKYQGEYSNNHTQINKKSSVQAVYAQLKAPYQNNNQGQRKYKFGEKILDGVGKQCYQIDQGGRITVFCVSQTRIGEQKRYSELKLQKETHMLSQHQLLLKKKQQQILKLQQKNKELTSQLEENSRKIEQFQNIMKVNNNTFFQVTNKGNRIRYNNQEEQYNHYAFTDKPIYINDKVQFYLKISKLTNNKIFIGIVDYFEQKNKKVKDIYNISISISGNGVVQPKQQNDKNIDKKSKSFKIKHQDIVKISVNRQDNIVEFTINNEAVASIKDAMLSDIFKIFVPYVGLMINKNCVEVWTKQKAEAEIKKKKDRNDGLKEILKEKKDQLKGEEKNQLAVAGQQDQMHDENHHQEDLLDIRQQQDNNDNS